MKIRFVSTHKELSPGMERLGYSPNVDFHLNGNEKYIVYGILNWKMVLHYLIIPTDLNVPYWIPADIFEVVDSTLPKNWYFDYFGNNDQEELEFVMGYKELAMDRTHYEELIEREDRAIMLFNICKIEIDQES